MERQEERPMQKHQTVIDDWVKGFKDKKHFDKEEAAQAYDGRLLES